MRSTLQVYAVRGRRAGTALAVIAAAWELWNSIPAIRVGLREGRLVTPAPQSLVSLRHGACRTELELESL